MKFVAFSLFFLSALVIQAQPNCATTAVRCVGSGKEYTTIQSAADDAVAGDQVYVYNGSYTGFHLTSGHSSGSISSPITFTAQSTSVNITAAGDVAGDGIQVSEVDYVVIDGFTITNMTRTGVTVISSTGTVVKNCVISGSNLDGILTGFAVKVLLLNNTISGTVVQHGIYLSNSNTGADRPIARGNVISNSGGAGIQVNGDCATLDSLGQTDGIMEGALIENNIISGSAGNSLSIISMNRSIIRNNVLTGPAITHIKLASEGSCHLGSSYNLIVNNTVISTTGGAGIRQIDGTGNVAFNNLIASSGYKCVVDATATNCDSSGTGGIAYSVGLEQSYTAVQTGTFTNFGASDFTLLTGSPAINVGVSSFSGYAAPPIDLLGNGRPVTSWDAGAYEYGASGAAADTTAPTTPTSLAGVSTPYQVSLTWTASTDGREVLGYEIARDSAPYAISLTNSFIDTSVIPGSSHTYSVLAFDGLSHDSSATSPITVDVAGVAGCTNSDTSWRSALMPSQTGTFTLELDAVPSIGAASAVIGLGAAVPAAYSDMPVIFSFGANGKITIRDGATYNSDVSTSYTAGVSYHFRAVIDIVGQVYDVYVTEAGGMEVHIATAYDFRAGTSASSLGYLATTSETGSVAVCDPSVNTQLLSDISFLPVSTTAGVQSYVGGNGSGAPVLDRPLPVELTTSRDLAVSDNGHILYYAGSGNITLTIPSGLGASFYTSVVQQGSGTVHFSGGHSLGGGSTTIAQWSAATVQCTIANTCLVWGQLQ